MEEFREIFPKYHVSTVGNVKSFKRKTPRILKPTPDDKGYLRVILYIGGEKKTCLVHRLVALAFIPNPDNLPQVHHKNGIKTDNRVENLKWVTNAENIQHAYDTGLEVAPQGENNYQAKLTNEQARYIRENPDGLTTVELGKMFGVAETTISAIQLGKKYRNAGGQIRQSKNPRVPAETRAEIRRLYAQGGISTRALAKQFGIGATTVRDIINEG